MRRHSASLRQQLYRQNARRTTTLLLSHHSPSPASNTQPFVIQHSFRHWMSTTTTTSHSDHIHYASNLHLVRRKRNFMRAPLTKKDRIRSLQFKERSLWDATPFRLKVGFDRFERIQTYIHDLWRGRMTGGRGDGKVRYIGPNMDFKWWTVNIIVALIPSLIVILFNELYLNKAAAEFYERMGDDKYEKLKLEASKFDLSDEDLKELNQIVYGKKKSDDNDVVGEQQQEQKEETNKKDNESAEESKEASKRPFSFGNNQKDMKDMLYRIERMELLLEKWKSIQLEEREQMANSSGVAARNGHLYNQRGSIDPDEIPDWVEPEQEIYDGIGYIAEKSKQLFKEGSVLANKMTDEFMKWWKERQEQQQNGNGDNKTERDDSSHQPPPTAEPLIVDDTTIVVLSTPDNNNNANTDFHSNNPTLDSQPLVVPSSTSNTTDSTMANDDGNNDSKNSDYNRKTTSSWLKGGWNPFNDRSPPTG